jgi:hypothetical protein
VDWSHGWNDLSQIDLQDCGVLAYSGKVSLQGVEQMGTVIVEQAGRDRAREVLEVATRELQVLMEQRADIVRRIRSVRTTIFGLADLFGKNSREEFLGADLARVPRRTKGVTDACRLALKESEIPLTSHQVRDKLRFQGLEIEQHKDPVATVTTILGRLVEYGEAATMIRADGKRTWMWMENAERQQDVAEQPQHLRS